MLSLCVCITGFLAAVVGSVPAPVAGVNTPTEQFNKSEVLDVNKGNKYKLFWKFNDTHITFEVHVKTTGFVGFGISDNGGMYPGDVVVGWVKNGSVHFKVNECFCFIAFIFSNALGVSDSTIQRIIKENNA